MSKQKKGCFPVKSVPRASAIPAANVYAFLQRRSVAAGNSPDLFKQPEDGPLLIRTHEVAKMIGLTTKSVYALCDEGELPRPIPLDKSWNSQAHEAA